MKKNLSRKFLSLCLLASFGLFTLQSCKPKDADIAAAVTEKVKAAPELSGVSASVKDGVVTLTGEVKEDASKSIAENLAKGVKGVKDVTDNITTAAPVTVAPPAPVVINADSTLIKSVTDATKDFAGVKADVKEGIVTLTGDIKRTDLQKLMMTLHTLKPKKIENKLTIK